MIKLKELHLSNFRGWRNLHLTHMDTHGRCLILGGNGAGKSSIRQAIEFALLDKTSDGLPISELSHNGEAGEIRCVLEKDEDKIEIRRSIGKNIGKKLYVNDKLYPDDDAHAGISAVQKEIEKLLNIDEHSLFVSTVFSKNSPSFPSSAEADRKKILYDALSLHKYNEYHENAKSAVSGLELIMEDRERLMVNYTSTIEKYNEDLVSIDREEKKWLDGKQDREHDLVNDIQVLSLQLEGCKQDRQEAADSLLVYDHDKMLYLQDELDDLEEEKYKIVGKMEAAELQLDKIKNTMCPVLNKHCDQLEFEIMDIEKEWQPEVKEHEAKLDKVNAEIDKVEMELETLTARVQINGELEERIDRLTNRMSDLVRRMDDKNARVHEIRDEESPFDSMREEIQDKLADQHDGLSTLVAKQREDQEDLAYYEYWAQGFSKAGIPNMKVEGFLEAIETKTNQILADISQGMRVDIQAQAKLKSKEYREKIQYHVLSADRSIKDFKSYSEGQKQRVRIADIFAFNVLTSKFNFIFLDEVLEGSLDSAGKDVVMDFLRKRAREVDTMFVISHSRQIQDQFDKVIKVRMKDGVSKLS